MRFIPSVLTSVIATCSFATAQSFNLDIESQVANQGQLSASYGAASGQSGFWNQLPFTFWDLQMTMLDDLSGIPTSVFAWSNEGGGADLPTPCVGWGAEEVALYDGISGGHPLTLRISGLVPDVYTVFVYAKSDDSNRATRVRIMPAVIVLPLTNIIMAVCPPATALHSEPETFTLNTANIGAGDVLQVEVTRAMLDGGWKLSAVQIIKGARPVGTTYCSSLPNSTGFPAVMTAVATPSGPGQASIAANDLVFTAFPVPTGGPALFFYGPNQVSAPFGNGVRCVGGAINRLPLTTIPGQLMTTAVDYSQTVITAGSTWNFQGLFRDLAAGGAQYNLTSAMQIQFGL